MWGVSRTRLDNALLSDARDAGATVWQPARCEKLELVPSPTLHVRDLASNTVSTISPKYVLLADGKAGLLARRPAPTRDLGLKAHFADVNRDGPRDAVELFGVDGHYGGVAPVEGGLTNVSFSVPIDRVNEIAGDLDALFERLVAENEWFARRMQGASRAGQWIASPLPRFALHDRSSCGIIRIGNAAAAIEPIGGEGMGLAMRSAQLAAEAIIDASRDHRRVDRSSLARAFRQLWRARGVACRATAIAVSSPRTSSVFVRAARTAPASVTRLALRAIGKR
jgi:flavin-dependent dehydrogenase